MSIYATLRTTTVKGERVYVQGVPAHIDWTGPEWDFLGPPAPEGEDWLRTIFVVDDKARKTGQRYDYWLFQMTPNEYVNTNWRDLRKRIVEALKERPA
jgi:hypothetical protein